MKMNALKLLAVAIAIAILGTGCSIKGGGFRHEDVSMTRCNKNGTRCTYRSASEGREVLGTAEQIGIAVGVAELGLGVVGGIVNGIFGSRPAVAAPGTPTPPSPVYGRMNPCQLTDPTLQAECLQGLREGERARYEEERSRVRNEGYNAGYYGY